MPPNDTVPCSPENLRNAILAELNGILSAPAVQQCADRIASERDNLRKAAAIIVTAQTLARDILADRRAGDETLRMAHAIQLLTALFFKV